jgi:hypothetical protein
METTSATIDKGEADEPFSLLHWLLVRRAAFRDAHGDKPPRGMNVSTDAMRRLRAEYAEKVGPRYSKLIGGPSLFYGMIVREKPELADDEIEFWR